MEYRKISKKTRLCYAMRIEATADSPPRSFLHPKTKRRRLWPDFTQTLAVNLVFGDFDDTRLVDIAGLRLEVGLKVSHTAVLWGVYVTPSHRGLGVARNLIENVVSAANALPGLL